MNCERFPSRMPRQGIPSNFGAPYISQVARPFSSRMPPLQQQQQLLVNRYPSTHLPLPPRPPLPPSPRQPPPQHPLNLPPPLPPQQPPRYQTPHVYPFPANQGTRSQFYPPQAPPSVSHQRSYHHDNRFTVPSEWRGNGPPPPPVGQVRSNNGDYLTMPRPPIGIAGPAPGVPYISTELTTARPLPRDQIPAMGENEHSGANQPFASSYNNDNQPRPIRGQQAGSMSASQGHDNLVRQDTCLVSSEELTKREDEAWVKTITGNIHKHANDGKGHSKITVSSFQASLSRSIHLKEELEKTMDLMRASLDDHAHKECATQLAVELKTATDFISDAENQETVYKLIQQRKLKRARLKAKRQAVYEDKLSSSEKRKEKHKIIDRRLEQIAQIQLTAKQDREMKTHADSVQGEVRKKLSETEKTIDLLKSVRKLRKVRLNSIVSRGINANMALHEQFETKIGELLDVMARQKVVYEAEAKTLEVMLGQERAETEDKEKERIKRRHDDLRLKLTNKIQKQLFGKPAEPDAAMMPFHQYYTQAECNIESLLMVRSEWDRYLVDGTTPGASRIPCGWVEPVLPSHKHWSLCLNS